MQVRKMIDYFLSINNINYKQLTYDEQLQIVLPYIFNFDFPIFDENYRTILETMILKRYYFRSINYETISEWQFRLEEFLQRRMHYYNRLYRSVRIEEYDPRKEVKLEQSYSHNINTKRDSSTQQTANSTENSVANTASSGANENISNDNTKGSQTGSSKTSKTASSDSTTDSTSDTKTTDDTTYSGTEKQTSHEETLGNKQTLGEDTPQENIEINDIHASNINRTNENATKDTTAQTDTNSDTKVTGDNDNVSHSETKTNSSGENDQTNVEDSASETHSNSTNSATSKSNDVTDTSAKQNTTGVGNEKITTLDNYILSKIGRNGNHSLASLISEQRAMFLDVNTKLLNEINPLFNLMYNY